MLRNLERGLKAPPAEACSGEKVRGGVKTKATIPFLRLNSSGFPEVPPSYEKFGADA